MVSLHLLRQINFPLVQPKPQEVQWQSPVCQSCCPQDTWNKMISRYCRNSSEVFSHIIFIWEDNFEKNRWLGAGCSLALIHMELKSWKSPLRPSSPTTNWSLTGPPLNHVPKHHIYRFFEYFQGRWFHFFPGQPVPVTDKPFSEEIFPNIESKICLVAMAGTFSGPHCAGTALISFDEPKETWAP